MNKNKKNTFKVIAMGRVGTLAINRFIDEHPNITLPNFKETSKLLSKKWQVSQGTDVIAFDKSNSISSKGFLIHDAAFFEKKHKKALGVVKNFKADGIIHVVRNPYEQALSWINYINACAILQLKGWKRIEPSIKSFYKHYKDHLDTLKIGKQCTTFYEEKNKNVKVVDFNKLLPDKVENTMKSIYQFLNVDDSFKSTILQTTQNSYTREMLYKGIAFELNGEVIEMAMAPLDQYNLVYKNIKPWLVIHDTQQIFDWCPTVPKMEGDWVFLPKNIQAANSLSLKTRKMLAENAQDIVSEVLPVWAKAAENLAQQIETSKIRQINKDESTFLFEYLKMDLQIFFNYHPQFKTMWDI